MLKSAMLVESTSISLYLRNGTRQGTFTKDADRKGLYGFAVSGMHFLVCHRGDVCQIIFRLHREATVNISLNIG